MTNINLSGGCGNSPKNDLIEKMTVALLIGDSDFALARLTADIRWEFVGRKTISGAENIDAELSRIAAKRPLDLTIATVVSHGRAGAVSGSMKTESGKTFAFSFIYEFGSAKAENFRKITSFIIGTG